MSHVSIKLRYNTISFAAKRLLSPLNSNHTLWLGLQVAECIISGEG